MEFGMVSIQETLAYLQEFRSQVVADIREYEAGSHFTGELRDGKRIDTTKETVAELKRRAAYLDKIIAAYKEHL
jgi:hypothetical protein